MKKSIASSQPGRPKRRSAKGISAGSNNEAPVFRVPGAKVGPGAATRRNTKADLREVPMLPPEMFRHVGPITTWAKSRPNKKQLTIRLDQNVYDWLKSKGPGYQSLLNGILREVMLAEQRQ